MSRKWFLYFVRHFRQTPLIYEINGGIISRPHKSSNPFINPRQNILRLIFSSSAASSLAMPERHSPCPQFAVSHSSTSDPNSENTGINLIAKLRREHRCPADVIVFKTLRKDRTSFSGFKGGGGEINRITFPDDHLPIGGGVIIGIRHRGISIFFIPIKKGPILQIGGNI